MMGKRLTTHPLEQFELLPPAFRNERRVRRVIYAWLTLGGTLAAMLCAMIFATAMQAHRDRKAREQLVAAALPLFDLRRDVFHLVDRNKQRRAWCESVESAKPDDNAFQTLAVVATSPPTGQDSIRIDRINIRLPLETPEAASETPAWATPKLAISAQVGSALVAQAWVERLNRSDRIVDVQADADEIGLSNGAIELQAIPRTTRVLP